MIYLQYIVVATAIGLLIFSCAALLMEWLAPHISAGRRFSRLLLGRIESTRRNRILISITFILLSGFVLASVAGLFWLTVAGFVLWLPFGIWQLQTALKHRGAA